MEDFAQHGEKLGLNLWAMGGHCSILRSGKTWSYLYFLRSIWHQCGGWMVERHSWRQKEEVRESCNCPVKDGEKTN